MSSISNTCQGLAYVKFRLLKLPHIALEDGIELVRVIHGSQDLEKAWAVDESDKDKHWGSQLSGFDLLRRERRKKPQANCIQWRRIGIGNDFLRRLD